MSIKYWVWLSALTNLRPETRSKLIYAFDDPEKLYFSDERAVSEHISLNAQERRLLSDKSLERAERILEKCTEDGIHLYTMNDSAYPRRLSNIYAPPILIYVKGKLPDIDEEVAIAVVGTRSATPYGIKMGRKIGFEITRGGGLVVSGLAAGVDSAAAEGALRAGGACIGVLGCAIDDVYPSFNSGLYSDVSAAGALISEYPPETPIAKKNFPERNRIISGLSLGVTVIEAPKISGAIITAESALEQGREVFAVPGNVDALNSVGTNMLISEGALLVTSGWDVLDEFRGRFPNKIMEPDKKGKEFAYTAEESADLQQKLAPETGEKFAVLRKKTVRKDVDNKKEREYINLQGQLFGLSETQLKIIAAIGEGSKHIDDIIDCTAMSAASVLSEMTVLQIKGFVIQEPGKRFSLNIVKA